MVYRLRADVALAAGRLASRVQGRRALMTLGDRLADGERVEQITSASLDGRGGILARTDRRLLFIRAGWTGEAFHEFPFGAMRALRWEPGTLAGVLTVTLGDGSAELRSLPLDDGDRLVDALRLRLADGVLPPAEPELPGAPPGGWPVTATRRASGTATGDGPAGDGPGAPDLRPGRSSRPVDVAAQLRELVVRRDAGLITRAQFDAERARLVRRP